MSSYYFDNSPIPNLPVFNASIYRDIVNRGEKGSQGEKGFQGFSGRSGTTGVQGLRGVQGFQGVQGLQGIQGVQGVQGLASSISVNNFVSGIQGLQSSFHYGGFQTARTQLLRADTIQTDTITNSGTTFKFNASNTANFDGQGIYMSMTAGTIPNLWLRSSTATNKVIAFGDNTGSIPSASIQNFTASSDLRFYTGGNNEMCRMGSASNTQFFYPLIGTNSTFTNNYGVGFQGTQGSFGFLGCDSLNTSSITLPSSFVNTYTISVTAGTNVQTNGTATGYYCTFGSLKFCWGSIPLKWTGNFPASGANTASLPSSFFNSIQTFLPTVSVVGDQQTQLVIGNGFSTSSFSFYLYAPAGSGSTVSNSVHFVFIGN